ncbi:MAG: hypothetical protein H0W81_11910 [Chloroflexi bacterium]|nr:hypothetical protein [Chloroflexota bacterium]
MPKTARTRERGASIPGQLELLIGTGGDSPDYLYLVRHHLGQATKFADLAYLAGAETYRGLVRLVDGAKRQADGSVLLTLSADPGIRGIPPRERQARGLAAVTS